MTNDLVFALLKSYDGDINYTNIIGIFSDFQKANENLSRLYNEELKKCENSSWLQNVKYFEDTNSYKLYGDDADYIELKIEAYPLNDYLNIRG